MIMPMHTHASQMSHSGGSTVQVIVVHTMDEACSTRRLYYFASVLGLIRLGACMAWICCRPRECQAVSTEAEAPE